MGIDDVPIRKLFWVEAMGHPHRLRLPRSDWASNAGPIAARDPS
jgi:hypothetical protein